MQNNTSKIIIALLVVLILFVGVGIVVFSHKKDSTENTDYNFPTSADITNGSNTPSQVPVSIPPVQTTTTTTNPPQPKPVATNEFGTYSNAINGFSFKYPSTWRVIFDPLDKNQVKVTTGDIVDANDGYPFPSYSITFKTTDKTFFNPPINTKAGQATYNPVSNSILIDGECRATVGLHGSSVKGVSYGGSLMSDPAYDDSAIVTTNKSIIVVHSEQGIAMTPELISQTKAILDSFKLLNGNNIFVPNCAS